MASGLKLKPSRTTRLVKLISSESPMSESRLKELLKTRNTPKLRAIVDLAVDAKLVLQTKKPIVMGGKTHYVRYYTIPENVKVALSKM